MKTSYHFTFLLLFTLLSCSPVSEKKSATESIEGSWLGKIHTQGKEIPFTFTLSTTEDNELKMRLLNADEELVINNLQQKEDSLIIPMHIFDTEIRAVVESGRMKGYWIKNYAEDYRLPFSASRNESRFPEPQKAPAENLSGKWAVNFEGRKNHPGSPTAIGQFEQKGNQLKGTFLTPTGDYRYLEGVINNKEFTMSSFDGENAYLFEGEILHENATKGTFWSGKSRRESWSAIRDEDASLPDAESLTFLKPGYEKIEFRFPDLEGNLVSLDDPKFRDKVVIVQVLGTWCPNCMDETRFLAKWYREHKNEDVAIIGLAYEKKDDFEYASKRVKQMAQKLNADYDFLIAGTPDKESTARTLPMLNHIMSFPTTIFIDKKGNVRKIHTGFYGPGTGDYYTEFVQEFNAFTSKLMKE